MQNQLLSSLHKFFSPLTHDTGRVSEKDHTSEPHTHTHTRRVRSEQLGVRCLVQGLFSHGCRGKRKRCSFTPAEERRISTCWCEKSGWRRVPPRSPRAVRSLSTFLKRPVHRPEQQGGVSASAQGRVKKEEGEEGEESLVSLPWQFAGMDLGGRSVWRSTEASCVFVCPLSYRIFTRYKHCSVFLQKWFLFFQSIHKIYSNFARKIKKKQRQTAHGGDGGFHIICPGSGSQGQSHPAD